MAPGRKAAGGARWRPRKGASSPSASTTASGWTPSASSRSSSLSRAAAPAFCAGVERDSPTATPAAVLAAAALASPHLAAEPEAHPSLAALRAQSGLPDHAAAADAAAGAGGSDADCGCGRSREGEPARAVEVAKGKVAVATGGGAPLSLQELRRSAEEGGGSPQEAKALKYIQRLTEEKRTDATWALLHRAATMRGRAQYLDPKTGCMVFTATRLRQSPCCNLGCRHCPHMERPGVSATASKCSKSELAADW